MVLRVAYSTTKPQVTALVNRFLNPKNQTSGNSDPCDHDARGRHQTRPPHAVKDRLDPGVLDAIATKFATGTRQIEMTAEYNISLSSVKRILRRAKQSHHSTSGS